MKKQKISLEALRVKSFVTGFEKENENTLKGGNSHAISDPPFYCPKREKLTHGGANCGFSQLGC